MPFSPRYQEATEPEIVDNIMAVVERDMKAALDHFYAVEQLPGFAIMTDGEPSAFKYPLLVLGVQRNASTESTQIDEGDYLDQVLTVAAGIAVVDAVSLKNVRAKARKYVRAFKSVIRSAAASDLLPATALDFTHTIDIDSRYLRHRTDGTKFLQEIEIEIKFRFGES